MADQFFRLQVKIGRGVYSKRRRQREKSRRGPTPEIRAWLRATEKLMLSKIDPEALLTAAAFGVASTPGPFVSEKIARGSAP